MMKMNGYKISFLWGEYMTKGEVDYAISQALNNFDKWNDVT